MNTKWIATAALFGCAMKANATCTLADFAGQWRMYAWGGTEATVAWTKCTVGVNLDGSVQAGRVCEDANGGTFNTTGGLVSINNVCRVSGNIESTAGTITIIHSFVEADDANVWTGIVQGADGFDAIFNGVKALEVSAPPSMTSNCCLAGSCSPISTNLCSSIGGTPIGNTPCTPNPC